MADPTNALFVATMQALTVPGVTRHYDYPPESIKTADLPAAWPMLPNGTAGESSSTCVDGRKSRSMSYWIAVEAVGQNQNAANYGKLAALMDALEASLDAVTIFPFLLEYDITTGVDAVAGNDYWMIKADANGRTV